MRYSVQKLLLLEPARPLNFVSTLRYCGFCSTTVFDPYAAHVQEESGLLPFHSFNTFTDDLIS